METFTNDQLTFEVRDAGPRRADADHTVVLLHGFPQSPAAWDAVVLVYTHLPSAIRAAAHQRLAAGLAPGGWLVLEAFHPEQLRHHSGGPKDPDMLCTPQQLDADWAGLVNPVLSWHGETVLDEGPGHQGLAHVTRWVGQRAA